MRVSIIIPVYNAGDFVTQAVESALQQPETAEVILVEDGSPDNGLAVCQSLEAKHDRVRLFRHPDGRNHGAGASRNLGMLKSSCEFIAFLDADDYYLPGRFSVAKETFHTNPACEGVYEAVGMHVESEAGLSRYREAGRKARRLTTMSEHIAPEHLWEALVSSGKHGYFQLDGLTLRRGVLKNAGYMVESLRLHQDTEFMFRAATAVRLFPGRLDEPVAMARVHDHNRISAPRSAKQKYNDRMLMWMELYRWCRRRDLGHIQSRIMDEMILETISKRRFGHVSRRMFPSAVLRLLQVLAWLSKHPGIILEPQLWLSVKGLSGRWYAMKQEA